MSFDGIVLHLIILRFVHVEIKIQRKTGHNSMLLGIQKVRVGHCAAVRLRDPSAQVFNKAAIEK